MELLRSMTGVELLHVPFKGGAQGVTALLGEQIDFLVDGAAFGQVKAGRLKALAVTGPRLPALPDTPGIGESVKGFEFTNWWGCPRAQRVRRRRRSGASATRSVRSPPPPTFATRLSGLGLAARASTPPQFAEHLQTEAEKVNRIVKDAGIKFE